MKTNLPKASEVEVCDGVTSPTLAAISKRNALGRILGRIASPLLRHAAVTLCIGLGLSCSLTLGQENSLVEGAAAKATSEVVPSEAQRSSQETAKDNEAFKAEIEAFLNPPSKTPLVGELKSSTESTSKESSSNQETNETKFLRVTNADGEPQALETAIVRYSSASARGAQVDLIGAVHIGEADYYAKLNRLFDKYDVLLYELVAPEGTQIPLGGKRESGGFNPVAMMQDASKKMLGLESQLELIDYTKEHFVRADMTPTQMSEKMAERGDTPLTIALDTFADIMRQSNKAAQNPESNPLVAMAEDLSLSEMLGNPTKMKQLMAMQFASTGSLDMAMGESLNQLLIVDRNAEALRGLTKQLAAGKKRIGIFYGAAHLPDLEKHLVADFGMRKKGQAWLQAWDLTASPESDMNEPTSLLMNILKMLD